MLKKMLQERNLPPLQSRTRMLEILQDQMYGYIPAKPESLSFEAVGKVSPNFCAGKARGDKMIAHCVIGGKEFSFPFSCVVPLDGEKHPFFVHINFRPDVPDRYMPTEELVDNGYAVLSFNYNDVTQDNGDFTDGLAGILFENGQRNPSDPGKIALWAWAAQRLMDFAETLSDELDLTKGIVCGHSRLGKTALLTAATDERFAIGYSNDSGCSGAAISRGKEGETVEKICNKFPYWFCENYHQHRGNEQDMPFDQHYLLASIAPRPVLVGSASEDAWADPISEQLSCLAAAPAFDGDFQCDRRAQIGDAFLDGKVGYHLRKGLHYFSRTDWLRLMEFAAKHL